MAGCFVVKWQDKIPQPSKIAGKIVPEIFKNI